MQILNHRMPQLDASLSANNMAQSHCILSLVCQNNSG